jgi:hypothetical protein
VSDEKSADYLRHAEECRTLASKAQNEEQRLHLLTMARQLGINSPPSASGSSGLSGTYSDDGPQRRANLTAVGAA